jgi:hypothetical protein
LIIVGILLIVAGVYMFAIEDNLAWCGILVVLGCSVIMYNYLNGRRYDREYQIWMFTHLSRKERIHRVRAEAEVAKGKQIGSGLTMIGAGLASGWFKR